MTKDQIKSVLERVPNWPPKQQAQLAQLALEIEAELARSAGRGKASRKGATKQPPSPAERAALWRASVTGLPDTAPLSDEAISRESIYSARG
jgi:hypothetical protein